LSGVFPLTLWIIKIYKSSWAASQMRLLIIGDLHGNMPKIHYKDYDAIIAPGDFCSDSLRKYMFQALKKRLTNPKSKVEWYDLIGKKKAEKEVRKSLEDGRKVLKNLNSYGKPVYIVPGNWDWIAEEDAKWKFFKKENYEYIIKGLENIVDVHHKIINIKDYQIIGYGISSGPEYPQYKEDLDSKNKKKLRKMKKHYKREFGRIDSIFKKASKPVIFLSHNVPFNTPIDKITSRESPRYGYHYGSLIARKLIEKYQPLVSIGGHMHEHFGKCRIGKTTAINAGFGSYANTLIELQGNKIKKLEFYRGK